jgi:hypothetical protein
MNSKKKYYRTENRKEFYNIKIKECGGRCMICGALDRLVVDHCHDTGIMRGLLCYKHNAGMGMFADNPILLENAVNYLRKHIEQCQSDGAEENPTSTEPIMWKGTVNQKSAELANDMSFHSDRARARALIEFFPTMTEEAARKRISRVKQKMEG